MWLWLLAVCKRVDWFCHDHILLKKNIWSIIYFSVWNLILSNFGILGPTKKKPKYNINIQCCLHCRLVEFFFLLCYKPNFWVRASFGYATKFERSETKKNQNGAFSPNCGIWQNSQMNPKWQRSQPANPGSRSWCHSQGPAPWRHSWTETRIQHRLQVNTLWNRFLFYIPFFFFFSIFMFYNTVLFPKNNGTKTIRFKEYI